MLVNLSGRGDKDVDTAARWFGMLGDESADEADGTAVAQGACNAPNPSASQIGAFHVPGNRPSDLGFMAFRSS